MKFNITRNTNIIIIIIIYLFYLSLEITYIVHMNTQVKYKFLHCCGVP